MEFEILHAIQTIRTDALDMFMMYYSALGDNGLIWIILAIGLLAFPKTRFMGKVSLLAIFFEIIAVTFTLKPLINRARPCMIETIQSPLVEACYTTPSFPSGHTACAFAMAVAIFCINKTWGTIALLAAALMGFTRLYLFVHFPTDILGSIIVGSLCGYLAFRLYNRYLTLKGEAH